jgi:CDP-diacylglycerol--glycerol-3-phosphate 3-phosphatidyltransferase
MTLYTLKPRFQALLRPLVRWLAADGVTANQITVAAIVGSLIVAAIVGFYSAYRPIFLLLPLWSLIRMSLNAIDGMLAREFGQKSRLGAYLNEMGDVVCDTALYAPFALIEPLGAVGIVLAILLSALTEFAGILGSVVGGSRRYDGPLGKSDRAFLFGVLAVWVGLDAPLGDWAGGIPLLINVLLIITIFNRVRASLREARPR